MPPGSRISVRVGADHFTTGAGGELLINTELRGGAGRGIHIQQVVSRLAGGSRVGNGHVGRVVGHGIAVAVGIARVECPVVDRVLDEPDRAVTEREVRAARVKATRHGVIVVAVSGGAATPMLLPLPVLRG